MEPGFPKRGLITERGANVNIGGDYRYKYDLCPRARTVVVTDTALDVGTFSPLSIASTDRVATINLTTGYTYINILYRSVGREVWVFGTQNVIVIDANPESMSFNTIKQTITTGAFNSTNAIVYSEYLDSFITLNGKYSARSISLITAVPNLTNNSYYTATKAYMQLSRQSVIGNVNGEVFGLQNHVTDAVEYYFGVNSTLGVQRIADKFYIGSNTTFYRMNSRGFREAAIGITASERGDSAYNPKSGHIVCSYYNGNAIPIIRVKPSFANVGNLYSGISSILASNHTTASCVSYSPYSEKIYIKASNGVTQNSTGLNRYYIIDTSQSLANMVCGYREIDEAAIIGGAVYNNTYTCFNGLHINEYEF